jgi:hypothetical protein
MEVGRDSHGFHSRVTKDTYWGGCHLGSRGSTNKECSLHPIKVKDPMDKLARLYVQNIVRLHGVPSAIVSDRDSRFTSRFWQSLQKEMGTELKFSTAFHPQTDGQSERTNQVLEDMLRACVLDFKGSWIQYLP